MLRSQSRFEKSAQRANLQRRHLSGCGNYGGNVLRHGRDTERVASLIGVSIARCLGHFEKSAEPANLRRRGLSRHAGTPRVGRFEMSIGPMDLPGTTTLSVCGHSSHWSLRKVGRAGQPTATRSLSACGNYGGNVLRHGRDTERVASLIGISIARCLDRFEKSAQRANLPPRRLSKHAGTPRMAYFDKFIRRMNLPGTTNLSACGHSRWICFGEGAGFTEPVGRGRAPARRRWAAREVRPIGRPAPIRVPLRRAGDDSGRP
ncbi:hypothetical protein SCOR_19360 [Sulfidibacter corallicola]